MARKKEYTSPYLEENAEAIAAITAEGYPNAHENRKNVNEFKELAAKIHHAGDHAEQADKNRKCTLKTMLEAAISTYKKTLKDEGSTSATVTDISPEGAVSASSEDGKGKAAAA